MAKSENYVNTLCDPWIASPTDTACDRSTASLNVFQTLLRKVSAGIMEFTFSYGGLQVGHRNLSDYLNIISSMTEGIDKRVYRRTTAVISRLHYIGIDIICAYGRSHPKKW